MGFFSFEASCCAVDDVGCGVAFALFAWAFAALDCLAWVIIALQALLWPFSWASDSLLGCSQDLLSRPILGCYGA